MKIDVYKERFFPDSICISTLLKVQYYINKLNAFNLLLCDPKSDIPSMEITFYLFPSFINQIFI